MCRIITELRGIRPSWQADSFSGREEIPSFMEPENLLQLSQEHAFVPFLRETNPAQALPPPLQSEFFKIHFNSISHIRLCFPVVQFLQVFPS
jgi:hypothetical protein